MTDASCGIKRPRPGQAWRRAGPPSRTLRAACGGGLRPSLTADPRGALSLSGRDEETASFSRTKKHDGSIAGEAKDNGKSYLAQIDRPARRWEHPGEATLARFGSIPQRGNTILTLIVARHSAACQPRPH